MKFDIKIAATRWLIGALSGASTALVAGAEWQELAKAAVAGLCAAVLVDLDAFRKALEVPE